MIKNDGHQLHTQRKSLIFLRSQINVRSWLLNASDDI